MIQNAPDPPKKLATRAFVLAGAVAFATSAISVARVLSFTTLSRARPASTPHHLPKMFGGGEGVEVPARGKATAALIFLHGLGDTGYGWAPAFPLPALDHVKTILPTAFTNPVTLNGGFRMPSWFDLRGLDENAVDDEHGIMNSLSRLNAIIDFQVQQGIPLERIVVGGFSQGGALALTAALKLERRIAGFVALSAWLPLRSQYPANMTSANQDTSLFMGHGTADPVVEHKFGQMSSEVIKNLGRKLSFSSYPGLMHSASQQELNDVRDFLASVLPPV